MSKIRTILILALVNLPLIQSSWAQNTADEYETYINRMIPLSFDFSKVDAGLREHEVFVNLLSNAQTSLGDLSVLLAKISEESQNLSSAAQPTCPDQKRILEVFLMRSKLVDHIQQAKEHIAAYRSIQDSIKGACTVGFEHLHFGNNDFDILIPEIETMDGVYISTGNPFQSIIDLLSSLFSMFSNHTEASRIKEASQRFENSRAKDLDLQKDAEIACQAEFTSLGDSFSLLTQFANEAGSQLDAVDALPWNQLDAFYSQCIRDQEKQTVTSWVNQTIQSLDLNNDNPTRLAAAQMKYRTKMQDTYIRAFNAGCTPDLVQEIKGLIAIAQINGMQNESVYDRLLNAQNQCLKDKL